MGRRSTIRSKRSVKKVAPVKKVDDPSDIIILGPEYEQALTYLANMQNMLTRLHKIRCFFDVSIRRRPNVMENREFRASIDAMDAILIDRKKFSALTGKVARPRLVDKAMFDNFVIEFEDLSSKGDPYVHIDKILTDIVQPHEEMIRLGTNDCKSTETLNAVHGVLERFHGYPNTDCVRPEICEREDIVVDLGPALKPEDEMC